MTETREHAKDAREEDSFFHLNLEAFEGPLELLLDLIRKHEVDIFDIPISLITEEYLSFIKAAEDLDLEIGGEWLEMAALLILIKSRMLLPKPETAEEDGPDPREELVARLLEYQKYKAAARVLEDQPLLDRHVFKPPTHVEDFVAMLGPTPLEDASLSDLMAALKRVIERSKTDGTWVYEVNSQKLTLRSVILDIANVLQSEPRVRFDELFVGHELSRHRVITTFLAVLEMTRMKMLRVIQSRLLDEIYVERAVIDILEVSQELELEG